MTFIHPVFQTPPQGISTVRVQEFHVPVRDLLVTRDDRTVGSHDPHRRIIIEIILLPDLILTQFSLQIVNIRLHAADRGPRVLFSVLSFSVYPLYTEIAQNAQTTRIPTVTNGSMISCSILQNHDRNSCFFFPLILLPLSSSQTSGSQHRPPLRTVLPEMPSISGDPFSRTGQSR